MNGDREARSGNNSEWAELAEEEVSFSCTLEESAYSFVGCEGETSTTASLTACCIS